jgi:hypothetical protein
MHVQSAMHVRPVAIGIGHGNRIPGLLEDFLKTALGGQTIGGASFPGG